MAASSAPASAPGPRSWKPNSASTRAKALFDLAEEAKAHLLDFAARAWDRHRLHAGPDVGRAQAALSSTTIARMPRSWRRASAIRISASWMRSRNGRAAGLDALFRRHARHRHRPYPPAEAGRSAPRASRPRPARSSSRRRRPPASPRPAARCASTTPQRHDHRRQGADRGQRLWRQSGTGECGPRHADRLLHRRDRAARRRQPGASRAASRSTIHASSCAISASRRTGGCCSAGARSMRSDDPQGHPHPHPQADRRDLSRPEGRRDHPWLGRLCRHHHAAKAVRARGDAERDLRPAAIPAMA